MLSLIACLCFYIYDVLNYSHCSTGQDENTSSPDTPTLRTAVCHFASALQQLKHERPVTLATTTSSVAGEMVTKKDSECEEGLQTDPSPNSAEQAPQLPTALSMREMEEYAALALAYVNLKLEDWVCAQFTLRKLLKTSMTSEHARYGALWRYSTATKYTLLFSHLFPH